MNEMKETVQVIEKAKGRHIINFLNRQLDITPFEEFIGMMIAGFLVVFIFSWYWWLEKKINEWETHSAEKEIHDENRNS